MDGQLKEKGGEVILTSPYPKHALATSRWTVISVDENGNKKRGLRQAVQRYKLKPALE